jgi:hypothetical protein
MICQERIWNNGVVRLGRTQRRTHVSRSLSGPPARATFLRPRHAIVTSLALSTRSRSIPPFERLCLIHSRWRPYFRAQARRRCSALSANLIQSAARRSQASLSGPLAALSASFRHCSASSRNWSAFLSICTANDLRVQAFPISKEEALEAPGRVPSDPQLRSDAPDGPSYFRAASPYPPSFGRLLLRSFKAL